MKNLSLGRSRIRYRFCVLFLFFAILAFISHAAGSTGTIAVSPSNIGFGSVRVGSSQSHSLTVSNPGGSKVTITQATLSGTGFTLSGLSYPLTLVGGQSATFTVTFAPKAAGNDSGTVSIAFSTQISKGNGNNKLSYSSSTTLMVPVSGAGVTSGQLVAIPSSINFGTVQVGSSQSQWETITNVGGSNVTISQATDAGTGFSISGLNLPITLTPSQSLTFGSTFTPQTASTLTGTITVNSDASNATLKIPQTGTGGAQGQLALSPTSANFGNVTVGTSTSQVGTLSVTGTSVTVFSASVSSPEFSLSGVTFPLTVAAGQTVPITVTFAPQASGTGSGTLSFASNASNSPTEALVGNGVILPQHSVSLSWAASASQVVGYNVYRGGTSAGPYTRINSTLELSTGYTDSSVQAGKTYYYVATAVDSTGTESDYSKPVGAVIPSP